ncbi:MAG: NAD(P)/FAD-dependent oxidoreductase [Pseudorhodoplanes sp.]
MSQHLTADFKDKPYWWDAAPPVAVEAGALLPSYDVAIVGSGYTGMRAALELARGGRGVAVFDKDLPGFGASRRNAGFLGRVLKKSYLQLKKTKDAAYATVIYRELDAAYQSTLAFVEREGIDCHAVRCGRFIAATSPAHYALLETELEEMRRDLGLPYSMLPKSRVHEEIASDIYDGGAVIPDLGSIHSGLYHLGLMARAREAGVSVFGNTEVLSVRRKSEAGGFEVSTAAGALAAKDVIVATNGYTPPHFGWHSRRVIPFTGYMAATEILPEALLKKMLPRRRTILDSNLNIDFFRPAPDTSRILFGGATANGIDADNVEEIATLLHKILVRALPDLADVKLSHVWTGQCAGTFDMMPHIGRHDGIWYGMGYNFAGVPMGSYFGMKLANRILGRPEGHSVFEKAKFPTMPFYSGNPWFLPFAMRYFEWQDRRLAARRPAA